MGDDETPPKVFVTIYSLIRIIILLTPHSTRLERLARRQALLVKQPPHDFLTITAKAPEAGYAYAFVSNEHPYPLDVYFDDVTFSHTPSPIVSVSDYFPFGLSYNQGERVNSTEQKYLYNGKELQDELSINWFDYGMRQYDPTLGRFLSIDPLADVMRRSTPYNYSFDNPVRFIDPDGMAPKDKVKENEEVPEQVGADGLTASEWVTSSRAGNDGSAREQKRKNRRKEMDDISGEEGEEGDTYTYEWGTKWTDENGEEHKNVEGSISWTYFDKRQRKKYDRYEHVEDAMNEMIRRVEDRTVTAVTGVTLSDGSTVIFPVKGNIYKNRRRTKQLGGDGMYSGDRAAYQLVPHRFKNSRYQLRVSGKWLNAIDYVVATKLKANNYRDI